VAVIMDGNGRWARRRRLPRVEGHRAGIKSAQAAMEVCRDQGIRYLTLYTFSLENWQRPRAEVDELMRLLHGYLGREAKRMHENRVRFRALGRLGLLPPKVRAKVEEITAATAGYDRLTLCLALSYGGRAEIVDAINALAGGRAARGEPAAPVTEAELEAHLYAPDVPPPDLVIRTSGERRLSNFLLWEAAHARLVFVPDFWPDFTARRFTAVIDAERTGRTAGAGAA
jgi:undecaprenyl diphosphate synthase